MINKRTATRQKVDTKSATVILIDDTGNFQRAAISTLGKEQKVMVLTPYGLCSNPSDESLAITFNINGVAANTVAIIDDPKNRKKNLAKGEVALYNYETESIVYLKEDNSVVVELASGKKFVISDSGIAMTGNASITGDLSVTGAITATGNITCADLATSTITSLNAHVHNSGTLNIAGTPVTGTTGTSP